MKLHLILFCLCVITHGSVIAGDKVKKRDSLDFLKAVKDLAKAKLLNQQHAGGDKEDADDGHGNKIEDDGGDVEEDDGDDVEEEDEEDAEVYDDENPSYRYNAGKISLLKEAHEFGLQLFEETSSTNGSEVLQ